VIFKNVGAGLCARPLSISFLNKAKLELQENHPGGTLENKPIEDGIDNRDQKSRQQCCFQALDLYTLHQLVD
jgi:hypothetical protein